MKILAFSLRTAKEILRDPVTLVFGLGFPLVLLGLMTAIQANIPVELFAIDSLTPGIVVFGLSFMSLFAATLVSKDRESAFLQRLYTTPLTAKDFILGYLLPLIPMAFLQSVICYLAAICLGLPVSGKLLLALACSLPAAIFFIALGLFLGSLLKVKQASGICGGLLTNMTAFLSGAWVDLSLVGGVFEGIANLLPFAHAVELGRCALAGNYAAMLPHLLWTVGYAAVGLGLAILFFFKRSKK